MKSKILIMITLTVLFISTGCSNNTQKLICTSTENNNGLKTSSIIEIRANEKEVKDMKLTLNITFSEEMQAYKQVMINQLSQKTSQVYTTKDGIKAIFGMDSSYFKELGLSKDVSYGELKQVLIIQGYTCEE